MRNRETIIALRARHTSYRIASDILHPPLESPPLPVVPVEDHAWVPREPVVPAAELLAKANARPPSSPSRPRRLRTEVIVLVWTAFWMIALLVACAVWG
jgi:hypothetical protein